jgi:hypothetical protein
MHKTRCPVVSCILMSYFYTPNVKVKIWKFTLEQAMKTQRGGGAELWRCSRFNLGTRWGGWSTPRPGRLTPGKGTQGRAGRVWKTSPPPGLDPRTIQSAASRCTDWAIPAHTPNVYRLISLPSLLVSVLKGIICADGNYLCWRELSVLTGIICAEGNDLCWREWSVLTGIICAEGNDLCWRELSVLTGKICADGNDLFWRELSVLTGIICANGNDLCWREWFVLTGMICSDGNDLCWREWSVLTGIICANGNYLCWWEWSVLTGMICADGNDLCWREWSVLNGMLTLKVLKIVTWFSSNCQQFWNTLFQSNLFRIVKFLPKLLAILF